MSRPGKLSPFGRPPWLGWAALIGGLLLALASATLQHAAAQPPAVAAVTELAAPRLSI